MSSTINSHCQAVDDVAQAFKTMVSKREDLQHLGGMSEASSEGTTHSVRHEEQAAFSNWINVKLKDDTDLKHLLPLHQNGDDLYEAIKDGILLCKIINFSCPDTIDERAINKKNLTLYTKHENLTLALNSAQAIGCNIVNIDAHDLAKGKPHLSLGLLWQIIRIGIFNQINLEHCPGLVNLVGGDIDELADLMKLSPENILLRWVNHHLSKAGVLRRINNFTKDISDSEIYTHLLHQIAPPGADVTTEALYIRDLHQKAEIMLQQADKLGCRSFLTPQDVVRGIYKLNVAFLANLFNKFPALDVPEEPIKLEVIEESRAEKTWRNWMNSLGVSPFVNRLYSDLSDGLVLIQLFDIIKPGSVQWNRVHKQFSRLKGFMERLENCNYSVELGKSNNFSLVGIAGQDIVECNTTLVSALVWQLMRAYTLTILSHLAQADNGKPVDESKIVEWANGRLKAAGKTSCIRSFNDSSISTALPVIDLVDAIKSGSINYDQVLAGSDAEEKLANSKYAISMARKIGAKVYALPEDIAEVKPKMVMTVFACLMATDHVPATDMNSSDGSHNNSLSSSDNQAIANNNNNNGHSSSNVSKIIIYERDMSSQLELRRLVEEYRVSLLLGNHFRVAELATKIIVQLVASCDDDLQNQSESKDIQDESPRGSALLVVVDKIIKKLQWQSQIASAYHDVIEFVRVWDMVRLSQLVGAIPKQTKRRPTNVAIDLEELSSILRKSIYLLRLSSPRGSSSFKKGEVRLKRARITCQQGIGFPRFTIDLSDLIERKSINFHQPLQAAKLEELLSILDPKWSQNTDNDVANKRELLDILLSSWFKDFATNVLDKNYPLDRFTLLVAILIIGDECEHNSIEQLIGALIDQIFHQETNSCNEEELMQLTQVGSFWLSHHKRHRATYKPIDYLSSRGDPSLEAEEEESDGDGTESSSSLSQSSSNPTPEVVSSKIKPVKCAPDLKPQIRKLIDSELLNDCECLQCGYEVGELLSPLNGGDSCEKCHNGPSLFCSLSYQPLNLISLDSLITSERLTLRKLFAYSCSEWTRQILSNTALFSTPRLRTQQLQDTSNSLINDGESQLSERVDIGENFERLTMVRSDVNGDTTPNGSSAASSSDGDEDNDDDEEEEEDEDNDGSSRKILAAYMRSRVQSIRATRENVREDSKCLSETLRLLRFAGSTNSAISLPICQSDVLIFDQSNDSISVRLSTSASNLAPRLYCCSARSSQSGLQFGCGRMYDGFELVRLTGQGSLDSYLCPHCECHLEELRNLQDSPDSSTQTDY